MSGRGVTKEIGWGPVRLTDEGRASVLAPLADLPVLHWHGDLATLPEGATRLAETDVCRNQAFAVGDTSWRCSSISRSIQRISSNG